MRFKKLNSTTISIALLFLTLIFLPSCLASKNYFAQTSGKVIDTNKTEIQDALVTTDDKFVFTTPTGTFKTDDIYLGKSGGFGCASSPNKTVSLTVQKEGYKTYTSYITLSDGQNIIPDIILTKTETTNNAPVIESLTAENTSIKTGDQTIITTTATDKDNDTINYLWSASSGTITGEGKNITYTAPSEVGTYTITLVVNDGKGGIDTKQINITVVSPINHSPLIFTGPSASPSAVTVGNTSQITLSAGDEDGDTLIYQWTATGGQISGSGDKITWTAPTASGTFAVNCLVSDNRGGVALGTTTVTVTGSTNQNPQITEGPTLSTTSLPLSGQTTITAKATDADNDTLSYNWSATGGQITGSGDWATYTAPNTAGSYSITLLVSDGKGGVAVQSTIVNVAGTNHNPIISSISYTPSKITPGTTLTITVNASDEDNDTLSYTYSKTDGTISGSGYQIQYTAPSKGGTYYLFVTVSDNKGGFAQGYLEIKVSSS